MSCVLADLSSRFDQENLGSPDAQAIVEQERRDSDLHMDADLAVLRRACLINNLSDEDLLRLYAGAESSVHSPKEELVDHQHGHKFRLITQGAAELVACAESGEEICLGVFSAGDYIHDPEVCGCHSKVKIRALGELRILSVDSSVINELSTEYPHEAQEFFDSIERQTVEAGWALKKLDSFSKPNFESDGAQSPGIAAVKPASSEPVAVDLKHPDTNLTIAQMPVFDAPVDLEAEILELEMTIDELLHVDSFLYITDMARVVESPLEAPVRKKIKGPKLSKFWRHKKVWSDELLAKTGNLFKEDAKKSEEIKEARD